VDIESIIEELKSERDRIEQVIGLLEHNLPSPTKVRLGRPPAAEAKPRSNRAGRLTPAGRRRLSEAMKRRWAERRGKGY
jgi:hypothetical protein